MHNVYGALYGAPFLPKVYHFNESDYPMAAEEKVVYNKTHI